MHYISEPLVVEQLYQQLHQLIELPEANKSSAADKPENKEKVNWMQVKEVRETITACSRASYVM
jgi:hypothetical protein